MSDFGEKYWCSNGEKRKSENIDSTFRKELPEDELFTITSKAYSVEKHSETECSKYSCYYQKETESLILILDEKVKFSNFSRCIMVDLIDFAERLNVKLISLLICKKNPEYAKFLQGMLTIGFEQNQNAKSTKLDGKVFRILSLKMNTLKDGIVEIDF